MIDIVTAITELRRNYDLTALLEFAVIPKSTYYYHCKKAQSKDKYKWEKAKITAIYKKQWALFISPNFTGTTQPRICFERQNRTETDERIDMEMYGKNQKYRSYLGEVGKTDPNLLNRDFHTEEPKQKWVTDVTEFFLFGRKLYLSQILDMYNGEIIGYAINEWPNFE